MTQLVTLMEQPAGRTARIVLGAGLMIWGFGFSGGSPLGLALGIVGIIPVAMGSWGRCLLAPLNR